MFTKTQLIEKGKHYFDDKSVNVMLATSDGNFFYENCKSYADSHSKTRNIELFEIKRADLKAKPVEKEETGNDDELSGFRKEAKELKIKGSHLMGIEKLKKKIAEIKE